MDAQVRLEPKSRRERVLVIDDDVSHLSAMRAIFESLGSRVDISTNGWDGVQLIRQFKYSAVILDWQMPELNGKNVLYFLEHWALSDNTRVEQIPKVIICTGVRPELLVFPFSNLTSVYDIWQKADGWNMLKTRSERLLTDIYLGG